MTIDVKTVGTVLVGTFAVWYLLRMTSVGSAYASDMWSIPQFFSSFIGMETPTIRSEIFRS
jgi:hypothetical protein